MAIGPRSRRSLPASYHSRGSPPIAGLWLFFVIFSEPPRLDSSSHVEGENDDERIEVPRLERRAQAHGRGCRDQRRVVAQPAQPEDAAAALLALEPHAERVRLRGGVQDAGPRRGGEGPARAHDRLPALVAGRLRSLRPVLHPHGVAQRGHVPHRRRSRRWRRRSAALRPAQQLARQRQPRQGAAPAVAHQAQVRPQAVLGRLDDPGRQRGHRVHGPAHVRLRRWARGHLGARGRHLLGPRGQVAGRRALQRRPRAREPARRGADGPHLREPGGAQWHAGPARLRA